VVTQEMIAVTNNYTDQVTQGCNY